MKEQAVLDRFEGEMAVLLVGEQERQLHVPRKSLPRETREGTWLLVELDGDHLKSVQIDPEETERARRRIAEKLDRLRRDDHLR